MQEAAKVPVQTVRLPAKSQSNVTFGSDSKQVVLGSDSNVTLWETPAGKEATSPRRHPDVITSVAVSADGQRLASASKDGTVRILDYPARREIRSYKKDARPVYALTLSPDGRQVATAHGLPITAVAGEVRLWNASTGQETASLKGHTAPVMGLAFSSDGKRLASASWDGTVRLWDADPGKLEPTLMRHRGRVHTAAFSLDGKRLASAGEEVKIWVTATGKELLSLPSCTRVAFSPDGQRLATVTGPDVMLRNASDGQILFSYHAASGEVLSIAFSPDGKRLVSLHADRTVRIWNAAPLDELPTKAASFPIW